MALSGGYSVSNRPATAYSGRRGLRRPQLDRLQRQYRRQPRHAADAERPGSGDVPERPVPQLHRRAPELRPDAAEQPGRRRSTRGTRPSARQYHNFNVTLRRQLPASFSMTVAYIGAHGTRLPFALDSTTATDQPDSVRRGRAVRRPAVQQSLEPAAARHPAALRGLRGNGAAGAAALPAVHELTLLNNFRGKTRYNSLQTTLERHFSNGFAAARRLHLVQDRRQLPQAGWVRRGVGDWRAAAGTSRTS